MYFFQASLIMTSISILNVLFSLCITLVASSPKPQEKGNKNFQKLALANNELAFNLHQKLASGSSENVFFSPFSISTAFAMLFYGARGDTAQELKKGLGYEKADIPNELVHKTYNHFLSEVLQSGDSSNGYVLNAANAILIDKNLKLREEYRSKITELYKAAASEFDFQTEAQKAVKEMNDWVKKKTNGKIEKIFEDLSPSTVSVLLNAVYFKGTWKTQFEKSHTNDQLFYNNGLKSSEKKVPFMHLKSTFLYANADSFQALELPYKGDKVSMLILLPNEREGLAAFENSFTQEKLLDVQGKLKETEVEISLPKFKLQYEKELSPVVQALGIKQIFSADSADFSGMTPSKKVFVSQVLHKAIIEVNEEGSEAAAVTGIAEARSINVENKVFKADHPFWLAIVEKGSNMILFLGRVSNL